MKKNFIKLRNSIKKILAAVKIPAQKIAEFECFISRRWVFAAHKHLMFCQWGLDPTPEFFDHHIDLYYQWGRLRNSLWIERGAFGSLVLKGGDVLELACGDGFNATYFYSLRSKSVLACDFDVTAIKTATSKNRAPNVRFVLADIRTEMPGGPCEFDNVVWDAAIEHFTEKEISQIMVSIKDRLCADGILSGYTIVERDDGQKHLHQHEYEFKSKEDLQRFLKPHFLNVIVFETIYPSRHNLYFWASDGPLPFIEGWDASLVHLTGQ